MSKKLFWFGLLLIVVALIMMAAPTIMSAFYGGHP